MDQTCPVCCSKKWAQYLITPKCWDVQGPKNDRASSSPPSRQKNNIVRLGQLPYPKQSLRISFGLAHAHHLAAAWHVTNALHGHRHWCHKCRPSGTDKFAKVTLVEGVFKMENVSVGWADVSMKLTTWGWSSHFFTKAFYRDTTSTTIYGRTVGKGEVNHPQNVEKILTSTWLLCQDAVKIQEELVGLLLVRPHHLGLSTQKPLISMYI